MKKRILGLVLAILLIVTILPLNAHAADNAPNLRTSEQGIAMIKRFEGLSTKAYRDGSQWTIGYGVACDPSDYPNGITEEEADTQLRRKIVEFEDSVNRFTGRYGIVLTQNQFDALASITFNLGASWINSSYRFWSMLRDGLEKYTDNQIASAIGVWCHVGSTISTGLIQRRMDELRVFLYNDYDGSSGNSFTYLIFNGNGGSVDTDVMLYRKAEPYAILTTAAREGYSFNGWFTAATGGTRVNATDAAAKSQTLYAQWSQISATPPPVVVDPPVTPPATGGVLTGHFSDVPSNAWYAEYVSALSASGVINGFGDGTFRPENIVTVGQALKIVLRAAQHNEQSPTSAHWASGYHTLALERAFVDAGDVQNLDTPATRAFVAKLAANALRLDISAAGTVFADTDDGHVNALQKAGIVNGKVDASGNRMFYPLSNITRAEVSKIVWNVQKLV